MRFGFLELNDVKYVCKLLTLVCLHNFLLLIYRKLLRLHNARSVILIVLCLVSFCDIGIGFLIQQKDENLSPYALESVALFSVSTISTAILVRTIEVKKNKSGECENWIESIHKVFFRYLFVQLSVGFMNLFCVNNLTRFWNKFSLTGFLFIYPNEMKSFWEDYLTM